MDTNIIIIVVLLIVVVFVMLAVKFYVKKPSPKNEIIEYPPPDKPHVSFKEPVAEIFEADKKEITETVEPDFIPSDTWKGSKKGYVFYRSEKGVGYHKDTYERGEDGEWKLKEMH